MSNSVAEFVRIGTLWGTPSEVSRLRLRGFRGAKILHGVTWRRGGGYSDARHLSINPPIRVADQISSAPVHVMAVRRVTLESLLERFTLEVRAGGSPSISQYAQRYPSLAAEIDELFPLVEGLERCKLAQDVEFERQNFPEEFPLQQLGDCRLVREIGRGGMGIVFEAIQAPAGRAVAIKLLPTRFLADRLKSKERFQREAVTIAGLRHQNIVPIYSFGEHDGYYFYIMQLVRGVSLDWVIRQLRESSEPICSSRIQQMATGGATVPATDEPHRRLARDSWVVFAKIGIQVALGIAHAHRHAVLHHDIKPANLLLNVAGRVVVTDFGGSYQRGNQVTDANEHGVGTLRYMAPERLRGRSDARSDVYSIGATLYELVTRQPAFDTRDRSRMVEMILNESPPSPRQFSPQLPAQFETIILTALSRNPAARHPTAKALADDLKRFVKRQETLER